MRPSSPSPRSATTTGQPCVGRSATMASTVQSAIDITGSGDALTTAPYLRRVPRGSEAVHRGHETRKVRREMHVRVGCEQHAEHEQQYAGHAFERGAGASQPARECG